MIVEDSKNFRLVFKALLKNQFRSVIIEEASSGEEALVKIQAFLPDIIFMDGELPDSSGLEITKTIRAAYGRDVGIIFLTSQDQDSLKKKALASGADAFFEKGTSIDDISVTISSLLGIINRFAGDNRHENFICHGRAGISP
ncbi:MAG: response regulator transcription factor [Desulfobacteraceae bacterium]|nr:response regulator transcription factor [Desulfobacteraceae bacterium]